MTCTPGQAVDDINMFHPIPFKYCPQYLTVHKTAFIEIHSQLYVSAI